MISPPIKSKLACEMVKLEPQKLNEAVHKGHLPCAGETRPGAARIFDLEGLVMLGVFSQMLKIGMNSANAGRVACGVHKMMADDLLGILREIIVYFDHDQAADGIYPMRAMTADGVPVWVESAEEEMKFSLLGSKVKISLPIGAMMDDAVDAINYQSLRYPLGED